MSSAATESVAPTAANSRAAHTGWSTSSVLSRVGQWGVWRGRGRQTRGPRIRGPRCTCSRGVRPSGGSRRPRSKSRRPGSAGLRRACMCSPAWRPRACPGRARGPHHRSKRAASTERAHHSSRVPRGRGRGDRARGPRPRSGERGRESGGVSGSSALLWWGVSAQSHATACPHPCLAAGRGFPLGVSRGVGKCVRETPSHHPGADTRSASGRP